MPDRSSFIRRHVLLVAAALVLVSGLAVIFATDLGRDSNAARIWRAEDHDRNAREGFAAQTWFELIPLESVPSDRERANPAVATYLLNPHKDAYKLRGKGLEHMKYVTLAWPDSSTPFVFDLFVHGERSTKGALAVRIPGFDVRKFLHQSAEPLASDPEFATLQAYFAEFSRKAKTFYRRDPEAEGGESLSPYELWVLAKVHGNRALLASAREGEQTELFAHLDAALATLGDPADLDRRRLNSVIRLAIAVANEKAERVADESATDPEFERLSDELQWMNQAHKIRRVRVTNNCREPGNYEIAVSNVLGNPLLRASFAFPPDFYDDILRTYNGLGIRAQGTGLRIPGQLQLGDPASYWESLLPWRMLKSFPEVNLHHLGLLAIPAESAGSGGRIAQGPIAVSRGRIPFEEYEFEVRRKSAFRMFIEPLSYVRVDPEKPPPKGFQPPDDRQPAEYWQDKANASKVVAHKYVSFEDLQTYDVHLSGFETSGVYVGKSDLEHYDKERSRGRWHFDYSYLQALEDFSLIRSDSGRMQIRLLARGEGDGAVNFVFGNIPIALGQPIEFLFGVATQPLASDYNDNVFQEVPLYAFAYDRDGNVLDHHDLRIGVERVYVEQRDEHSIKLRLISHERILPVWEGVLQLPTADASPGALEHERGRS